MTSFQKFIEGVSNYLEIESVYIADHSRGQMGPIDLFVREKRGFVILLHFKNVSYGCQMTFNRKRGVF